MIHFHNIFPSNLETDLCHNYSTLSQESNNILFIFKYRWLKLKQFKKSHSSFILQTFKSF